jgi:hypothetical protein
MQIPLTLNSRHLPVLATINLVTSLGSQTGSNVVIEMKFWDLRNTRGAARSNPQDIAICSISFLFDPGLSFNASLITEAERIGLDHEALIRHIVNHAALSEEGVDLLYRDDQVELQIYLNKIAPFLPSTFILMRKRSSVPPWATEACERMIGGSSSGFATEDFVKALEGYGLSPQVPTVTV